MAKNKYRQESFRGVYACGHEGSVQIGGYSEEYRQEQADLKFAGLCYKCAEIERQKEHKEMSKIAKEEAKEMGLPELVGTEKQVQWALSIRKEWMEKFPSALDRISAFDASLAYRKGIPSFFANHKELEDQYSEQKEMVKEISSLPDEIRDLRKAMKIRSDMKDFAEENLDKMRDGLTEAFTKLLNDWTEAEKYIDNRVLIKHIFYFFAGSSDVKGLSTVLAEYAPRTDEELLDESLDKKIKKERTVLPENFNGEMVTVKLKEEEIIIDSSKHDSIISIAKSLKFKWNGSNWIRALTRYNGLVEDRIAELGNKLLDIGFGVIFEVEGSKEIMKKAISGDYELEQENWIFYNMELKKLVLVFPPNDDLYNRARQIKGSKWESGRVSIPLSSYEEALEFADLMNFGLSEGAKEEIDNYKMELLNADKVKVVTKEILEDEDKLKAILESSTEPLKELIDD